jgi:hypothetical protein
MSFAGGLFAGCAASFLNSPLCADTNGCSELELQKEKTMMTKTLFVGLLTAGFLSASFDAEAEPTRSQQVKNVGMSQLGTTQSGARAGSMDSWPQTIDELNNAYNCGPYADKESAKKCKK